jgi:hypothetical protein
MTARLYVSIDRSGLTPRYIASPHMHPGARAVVWEPTLEAQEAFMDAVWAALKADANDLRKQQRIARALDVMLPAPPGAQEEGE